MLYCWRQRCAFSGEPVTRPARRQCSVFSSAGAICFSLKLPRPHRAQPSLGRDSFASARVTLVLMNGAAISAAVDPPMNCRREALRILSPEREGGPALTRSLRRLRVHAALG